MLVLKGTLGAIERFWKKNEANSITYITSVLHLFYQVAKNSKLSSLKKKRKGNHKRNRSILIPEALQMNKGQIGELKL